MHRCPASLHGCNAPSTASWNGSCCPTSSRWGRCGVDLGPALALRCIEITPDERLLSLAACTREPIGVLKVRVKRGINLAGANWKMHQVRSFTSDPYCILRLGGDAYTTSTAPEMHLVERQLG